MAIVWPEGLFPTSQRLGLRTPNTRYAASLTGHVDATPRDSVRWIITLTFELENAKARQMEALIARLRGGSETVLVPDFRQCQPVPVTASLDAYADEMGLTFFDDGYDFDDQSHEWGTLATEQAPPLGTETHALCGSTFDAVLVFIDAIWLKTEDKVLISSDVALAFAMENGGVLSLEHGDALQLASEQGYDLQTQEGELFSLQVGGGFIEGSGHPTLSAGSGSHLALSGLSPYQRIARAGDRIPVAEGHLHMVLQDVVTDINGNARITVAPRLRTEVMPQPLIFGGGTMLMRLMDDNAGENTTTAPNRSQYHLSFEQVLL